MTTTPPNLEDPLLKDVLQKVDAFFDSATDADLQQLLAEINYEFYRTVTETVNGIAASVVIEMPAATASSKESFTQDDNTAFNLIQFDRSAYECGVFPLAA